MTRLTHRAAERTSAVGAAPTPRTVRLLSAWWGATPGTSGCGSNPIPRPKPCVDTSMAAPGLVASSIPMNRTAIHRSFVRTPPCVPAARNGRDDDGDGLREVHSNTLEGLWSGWRTVLRPFRGVHTDYLGGYGAIDDFGVNLKRIAVAFIAALVTLPTFKR